jgi:hypothetical protein
MPSSFSISLSEIRAYFFNLVLVHIFQAADSSDHECTDDDIPEDSDADVNSPANEVRVYILKF